MVGSKVKAAMGFQKSPAHSKSDSSPKPPLSSPSSAKLSQKGAVFSRSFGVFLPRASAQVQPRPPDVTELLRTVEELRERESNLKTQLLEQKLLKESVAILPLLENELLSKDSEIEVYVKKIQCLEGENEKLKQEMEQQNMESEEKKKALETEISNLKKTLSERECDVSSKSNLMKSWKSSNTVIMNYKTEPECKKEEKPIHSRSNSEETFECVINVKSRVPRVPKPPPRPALSPSSSSSSSSSSSGSLSGSAERVLIKLAPPLPPPPPPTALSKSGPPPPPPPPPPVKGLKFGSTKVRRVPEVVEFYHSLMRRDSRRDSNGGGGSDAPSTTNSRDMIGEIENRSAHLLAIKTDVETQGDFINFLIKEVETAAFTDIEDVVPFVKWLDDELSYLVDERAVLKHFQWPEQKADTLREAAFGYCDLKKLECETSSFGDDPRQPCASALKKMQVIFEKLEHGVYSLSRMRESATKRYKVFQIPIDWMLDTGFVNQIKLASVKLAMKYMKRVSAELETVGGGPEEEELIVQGVRFAFRVHQFAGGFDAETMKAFQELRDKARLCHIQCQNQQQQRFVCRFTSC